MDDPVLKRKLFANRARHIKQIQTGNIPGHILGGLGTAFSILGRVGPAAMKGYRAFKAARAMPKPPSGLITGGNQPALATRIAGQQKGLRTTGLSGLEARALKAGRFPRGAVWRSPIVCGAGSDDRSDSSRCLLELSLLCQQRLCPASELLLYEIFPPTY